MEEASPITDPCPWTSFPGSLRKLFQRVHVFSPDGAMAGQVNSGYQSSWTESGNSTFDSQSEDLFVAWTNIIWHHVLILSSIFSNPNPWMSGSKTFEIYILAAGYKRDRADSKVPGMGGAILSDGCGSGSVENISAGLWRNIYFQNGNDSKTPRGTIMNNQWISAVMDWQQLFVEAKRCFV